MRAEPSDRAAAIFFALASVPPEERAGVIEARCGGDAALLGEVERLLRRLDEEDVIPEPPAPAAASGADATLQPPGAAIGGFVVVRPIGSGATGVVYLAQQQHPSRTVALKVLKHEFVASVVQRRFEIEAELLGRLQHPGIAQIYAAHPGDAATPPFIAMELVNGPPITTFVENRDLGRRERVDLLARVCDAVQHAHQRGIIHRDLKPGNILVDETGQPKVLDFGVARTAGAHGPLTTIETEAGQLVGTLAYMSPEQVRADPDAIDTRTDIHALGVILFRLLTGRLPFAHGDPPLPELARRIAEDNPPRLADVDPSLRGDLEIIVSRALAKEKERRYASAASLAGDLRRFLAGQPISASADSAWYLVRRQIGRYRLALALSAAALVALAGLAGYALFQRARADGVNLQLQNELATSTIDRGRLLSLTGNLPNAEELVWRELFRQPDSAHARWTLWDIYSTDPSLWVRTIHERGTQTLRFSPDNRLIATAGRLDGLLQVVDVESGRTLRTLAPATAPPQDSGHRRVLFAADGSIVAGADDGSVRIWDPATGQLRRELAKAIPGLQDFALGGDGRSVVAAANGAVQIWSLETGTRTAAFPDLASAVFSIALHPSGTVALAGGNDGGVTAIDLVRHAKLWRAAGHRGQVSSLAFAPDGETAASGGADGMVRLWRAGTGEPLRTIPSENNRVRVLSFVENGTKLLAGGVWRTRMFDLADATRPVREFGGSEGITDLHVRGDGRYFATSDGGAGRVRLWDLAADSRSDHWRAHEARVSSLDVADQGRKIVSISTDAIRVWEPGRASALYEIPAPVPLGLAASNGGQWIAVVGRNESSVWDSRTGRRITTLPGATIARLVRFSDDDRRIYIGQNDGALATWEWRDGVATGPRRVPSEKAAVFSLAPRGRRVFIAHSNRTVTEIDVDGAREARKFRTSSTVNVLALSPDGRRLAAGTFLGIVYLWDLETGRETQLKGHTRVVAGCDFSPDGRVLASGSRDGTTRLWDPATGSWLATVGRRTPGAERVRFLPDGRRLAIGYEDGELEIRDLQYFFRYVAGNAEYHLKLLTGAGESFPRGNEVLEWSRQILK